MKKSVKNILTLSLAFAMMVICSNLMANNPDETDKKSKKNEKTTPESQIQKLVESRAKVSKCIEDFDENSLKLLVKDNLLLRDDNKGYKYNSKGESKKEDYKLIFKSVEKVDDTTYYAVSEFAVYTMKTTIDVDKKGSGRKNKIEYNILPKKTVVTRPDNPKEKAAKELAAAKEDALKSFEAYKNENVNLVDLSSDCDKASKSVKEAKNKEEVEKIKETTLASMTEKVDAAKARIAAELEAADRAKIIVEEEATAFVNDYASQLASFVKNVNNMEEVLAMFANNEVEVTVSALNSANKTKTVAEYLNELSKLSNGTYKNNTQLNINVENVELLGTKAIVKVVQKFDGNGVYCDETVKSIELLKENEKVSINKIEVLETKSCK